MKTFVIDIGNSHTVMGVFGEEKSLPLATFRFRTERECTSDELYIRMKQFFDTRQLSLEASDVFVAASVVPELNFIWRDAFSSYKTLFINSQSPWTFKIALPEPRQVGADRLCNAEAVRVVNPSRPSIVIDAGTATTFDVIDIVDGKWTYLGGIILPGVATSFQSLVSHTSRLRTVEFEGVTAPVLGTTTESALQSGILHGFAAQVEGLLERLKSERPSLVQARIFATGGFAPLLRSYTKVVDEFDEHLTLKGLYTIGNRQLSL